jgi:hypothetical protein
MAAPRASLRILSGNQARMGLPLDVARLAKAVRGHWAIENNLHWILDVSFREDDNRTRKDHAPANLAWVRRMTSSLFAQNKTKVGVKCKRKMAGWNDEMFLRIAKTLIA